MLDHRKPAIGIPRMQQQLEHHWKRGQQFEAARDLNAARSEYEALIGVEAQHVPALLRLSRFAQIDGRYGAAHRYALRAADAIRLGASTRNLGYVTLRLLDFSEDVEVASVILSADWQDPAVLSQSAVLAQHLWLVGRYEDALRFLDAVGAHMPANHLLSFTRANVLRYLGQLEAASAGYEQCLRLRPDFADAHWAIATLRQPDPAARLARLRAARDHHPDGSLEQAHIEYALFHELDALGDTDDAWEALARGAAIMHAGIRHDVAARQARISNLMHPGWHPADAGEAAESQPLPVFLVGLPRTGTTLLDRIIGNHGWVTSVGERNDLAASVSEACDRFFTGMPDETDPEWIKDIDHRRVGQLYLERLRRHSSATALAVDKNPSNLFNIPLILRSLPQAKILVMRRDAMDSAFSNLKELFQGNAYPYSYGFADLAAHVGMAQQWIRYWAEAAPANIRVVDYESLVGDTEATMASVLDFLGIPGQPGLADITRNEAPVATASSAQVRAPIHGRGIGAWKRYARQLEPLRAALEGQPR
jgi:tetratricopeptide (TPR) repeat protein